MTDDYLLLTGVTGLLGQYLLRDLLLHEVPLAVLARGQGKESASERVERVRERWESELGRRLPPTVCLEGDITAPGLGMSAEHRRWTEKHCNRVLHNAASLTFFGTDRGADPWLSNLTGTTNMLEVCRAAGLAELHYVSTAYVCGKRSGVIFEDDPLDQGREFRNDYEAAKFEAETQVRSAEFLSDLTVYRPAIIVGDSATGYTATYHGLYTYLQFAWILRQYAELEPDGRWHVDIRLNLTGDEGRNLVPVDWVSAILAFLVAHPNHHGKTYHLTPSRPVTAREIEEAMSSHYNYYGTSFVGPEVLAASPMNELERTFYEYVSRYEPYWSQEPIFDCRNTTAALPDLPCPLVDQAMIQRLIEFAVQDRWGKSRR